jgi:hypothetical protein
MLDMREIVMWIFVAAVLVTDGCVRTPKRKAEFEAMRAEILTIEDQWATAIEQQDAAAFGRLAADFRFIDENGRELNRARYIPARSHNPENVASAVQDQIDRVYNSTT